MQFSNKIAQLAVVIRSQQKSMALVVFCLLFSVLTACSFRPLYGPTAREQNLSDILASIEISTIPGRVGQRLRNELIFRFTGGGYAGEPRYKLIISIRESVLSTLVQIDGDSRGQVYQLQANFSLFQTGGKEPILKGTSNGRAPFLDDPSVFSNIRARHDAENRAARTIAEDLSTRLSAFLSHNS